MSNFCASEVLPYEHVLGSLEKVCVKSSLITSVPNEEENDERDGGKMTEGSTYYTSEFGRLSKPHEHEFRCSKLRLV